MPGSASLRAGQYYAHPRNIFWPVVGELVGAGLALPYVKRVRRLVVLRMALWDVLELCVRPGSMDADIGQGTVVTNDFGWFFAGHPQITRFFFNGSMAERCYQRHAAPLLGGRSIEYARLPSTSPANASLPFAEKLEAWRAIVRSDRAAGRPVSAGRVG